jgi:acyl-CoA synthetase (AMP-forming)/AMP-acid ligase II
MTAILGQMMERPLLISSIIEYAALVYGDRQIISRDRAGNLHSYGYRDAAKRVAQLAHALIGLGVKPGDRIATVAWNDYRHFELYYAISGIGAICHTVNPRLFRDQLIHIFNHAEDRVVFMDPTLLPLMEGLAPELGSIEKIVVMAGAEDMPESGLNGMLCYEGLLEGQPEEIDWPDLDERTAAALCYTSGTTGNPKGALYSHRSTVLHAFSSILVHDGWLTPGTVFMPVVPMFHVCAWGYPYACPMAGASMAMPGPKLDGAGLYDLAERAQATLTAGVPTLWHGLMQHVRERGASFSSLKGIVCGGSAASLQLIKDIESHGIEFIHGWGLTETSPIGAAGAPGAIPDGMSGEDRQRYKLKQGRPMFGVDIRLVDDRGEAVPHDGVSTGEILMRGNTVISAYYKDPEASKSAFDKQGWLRTGDIGAIDGNSCLQLTDRAKDLIKSGGEWISSIDLESAAQGHSAVSMAAAIAIPHPKWGERPLLVVVPVEGETPDKESILEYLRGNVARFWVPDDIVFIDEMPLTATGKVSKRQLRQRFQGYELPTT